MDGMNNGSTEPSASLDAILDDVQLDALGLLDEDDRASLEAWLETLPSEARSRIRDEQERLASSAPGMEGIEPPADLRSAVVAAVLEALRQEQSVAATSETASSSARAFGQAPRRHTASPERPKRQSGRRVHSMWRAAAMGLSVALVSAVVFHLQTQRYVQDIESTASLSGLFDTFGSSQVESMLFDGSMKRVTFTAAEAEYEGMGASIWLDGDNGAAVLFTSRLPDGPGVSYRLAMVDENGAPADASIAKFQTSGVITRIALNHVKMPAAMTIALVRTTEAGEAVVMTASLA